MSLQTHRQELIFCLIGCNPSTLHSNAWCTTTPGMLTLQLLCYVVCGGCPFKSVLAVSSVFSFSITTTNGCKVYHRVGRLYKEGWPGHYILFRRNTLHKHRERNCFRTYNLHHRVLRVILHLESLSICTETVVYIRHPEGLWIKLHTFLFKVVDSVRCTNYKWLRSDRIPIYIVCNLISDANKFSASVFTKLKAYKYNIWVKR